MTAIKICGVRRPADVQAVRRAGADHIGLNTVGRSPRFVDPATAKGLAEVAEGLVRVGLFVEPNDSDIEPYLGGVDAIQLHGNESPARAADIAARFGKPVWKAVGVAGPADLDAAKPYAGAADFILFDAKPSPGELEGGRGVRIDWALFAGRRFPFRWGLAGGLTPDNVGQALAATNAPLVDVSSGVEEAPGEKSATLIGRFVEAVRQA